MAYEDEVDNDLDEGDQDDEDETIPCPHCGQGVYEDAEWCPHCEKYLSQEDAPSKRKPWWIVGGVILCFLILYRWIVGVR